MSAEIPVGRPVRVAALFYFHRNCCSRRGAAHETNFYNPAEIVSKEYLENARMPAKSGKTALPDSSPASTFSPKLGAIG